jgi:hypothetical protein
MLAPGCQTSSTTLTDTRLLCIQIISRHQQLQAQLWRNIHIRHVRLILVLVVVAEVFADSLEDNTA